MKLSKVERFLRLFTEVRAGEGATAILLFTNVFLLLCAYYFIKPLREGWISISDVAGLSKMEVKAYSSFGQSLVLVFVISWYGRLSDRMARAALINRATLFCMSNLVLFYFWTPGGFLESLPGSGIVFYLWVGMFGVFIVAQFWTFAADIYTDERGRRLMPMIAIGATGGAAFGSSIVAPLVESGRFGSDILLLAALVPLAGSLALTNVIDHRERVDESGVSQPPAPPESSGQSGLKIIFSSRFLIATAVITMLLSWVNTNGENLLFRVIQESLAGTAADRGIVEPDAVQAFTRDGTTAFYGDFYAWVNGAALVLQALVASRLLKYGGFGVILLMMPVISLLSYSAMAIVPILSVIKVMKIAENSTDYSINNTARNVLWLPVSSEMKFKGKPTIDTLFVRLGDGFAALTALVGIHLITLSTQGFFSFNVALVLVWIGSAIIVVREHRRLVQPTSPQGDA